VIGCVDGVAHQVGCLDLADDVAEVHVDLLVAAAPCCDGSKYCTSPTVYTSASGTSAFPDGYLSSAGQIYSRGVCAEDISI
jgi:hypothetical protein